MFQSNAVVSANGSTDPFVHEALFYAGTDDYLAGVLEFVQAGLDAEEPVLVAVPGENRDLVAAALGRTAARVRLVDMAVAGRNPGRIIGGLWSSFLQQHAGRRARIVGEPLWPARTATEYAACILHEALVNLAFAGCAATILCPYDTHRLSQAALLDVRRTHPVLGEHGLRVINPEYQEPVCLAEAYNVPLPDPGDDVAVEVLIFDATVGTGGVRRFLHERAERAGMHPDRLSALRSAVHEVVVNALVHTAGSGILMVWVDGDQLVCEVQDGGSIDDPLVGRRLPAACDGSGTGLYLVNQLCDLVLTHRTATGTTTRMYMGLAARVPSQPERELDLASH